MDFSLRRASDLFRCSPSPPCTRECSSGPYCSTVSCLPCWHWRASCCSINNLSASAERKYFRFCYWHCCMIVLLSALGYALYLVTVSQLKSLEMKGLKMTFYVFLFGGILLFIGIEAAGIGIQAIPDRITLGNLVMLALVPTVISNLALVRAIKNIGSTLTSVLGAMEPVTAVGVGILIFGEPFTQNIALGIMLIISAVTVIILKR